MDKKQKEKKKNDYKIQSQEQIDEIIDRVAKFSENGKLFEVASPDKIDVEQLQALKEKVGLPLNDSEEYEVVYDNQDNKIKKNKNATTTKQHPKEKTVISAETKIIPSYTDQHIQSNENKSKKKKQQNPQTNFYKDQVKRKIKKFEQKLIASKEKLLKDSAVEPSNPLEKEMDKKVGKAKKTRTCMSRVKFMAYVFLGLLAHVLVISALTMLPVDFNQQLYTLMNANDFNKNNLIFNGNIRPVTKENVGLPVRFEVIHFPEELHGHFVQLSPNPITLNSKSHLDQRPPYHWYDGHGMSHVVTITENHSSFTNTYVQTPSYTSESKFGQIIYPRLGEKINFPSLTYVHSGLNLIRQYVQNFYNFGVDVPEAYQNPFNAGFLYHNGLHYIKQRQGPLLAFSMVKDGQLHIHPIDNSDPMTQYEILAAKEFHEDGTISLIAKVDEYRLEYVLITRTGSVEARFGFDLDHPVDDGKYSLVVTSEFAIILDKNFIITHDSQNIRSFEQGEAPTRLGIVNRYSNTESQITWFELSDIFAYDIFYSMQTDHESEVKLTLLDFAGAVYSGTFNPTEDQFYFKPLNLPFPVGNPILNTKFTNPRFVYFSINYSSYFHEFYNGIMKFDMWRQIPLGMVSLTGITSGFTFVPKEDGIEDGYLVGYTYQTRKQLTKLEFITTPNMETFLDIEIPQRVPFGTQMHFIPAEEEEKRQF